MQKHTQGGKNEGRKREGKGTENREHWGYKIITGRRSVIVSRGKVMLKKTTVFIIRHL